MPRSRVSIPHVSWRDGRPRFSPGPALRAAGHKGRDLRHPDGRWYTYEDARAWSAEFAGRQIDAAPARSPARTQPGYWTVGQLVERWFRDPRLNGRDFVDGRKVLPAKMPNTVASYRKSRNLVERFDNGRIWTTPTRDITAPGARAAVDAIWKVHGLAQARAARAMLSAAFSWGIEQGRLGFNPFIGQGKTLPGLAPRVRFGEPEEMESLVAAADAIGLPEIGDAIVLGLFTAQRQNDRLSLSDGQVMRDGRLRFEQSKKHGQPLLIPPAPWLVTRIEAARRRRAGWRLNYPHIVIDEMRRTPFEGAEHRYRRAFALVRNAAVKGVGRPGQWLVEPTPSLADFRDQDLRDTAVTWLALAGCELTEIISITGHTLESAGTILRHYLGLHPELARSAIGKLVAWFDTTTHGGQQ